MGYNIMIEYLLNSVPPVMDMVSLNMFSPISDMGGFDYLFAVGSVIVGSDLLSEYFLK